MRFTALAALVGLVGSLLATLSLYSAANSAIDRVLDERLRGAGESAALLLGDAQPSSKRLAELMRANALDGAYLLGKNLVVLEDASGAAGVPADLLRVDADRVKAAFEGEASVAQAFDVGELAVAAGYFPVRGKDGAVHAVLALEAGHEFVRARTQLGRARTAAVVLSFLIALALGVLAARFARVEKARALQAERAARSEAVARMAAMVAHEIRNPLGVIRGTVELMRERSGASMTPRDQEALRDLLGEVERMKRLTEDFLDLGSERPLAKVSVDLDALVRDAAKAAELSHPGVRVRVEAALPAVEGDAGRLRQVLANLLSNAAQAKPDGEIVVRGGAQDGVVRIRVRDFGPGVPAEQRAKLFDPFFTTKSGGTGLGLAIARRLCERHGGSLALVDEEGPGAAFEVILPARGEA